MSLERWRGLPVRPWCVTARTDLTCRWCANCGGPRGRDFEPGTPGQPTLPEGETFQARLLGGDPFLHGDLAGWVRHVRRAPGTVVFAEGHGHHLTDAGALDRVRASGVDGLRVLLPALDDALLEGWTGVPSVASRTLDGIDAALDAGMLVTVVVAVNPVTVATLADTALGLAERFEGRCEIELTRAPLRVHAGPFPSPPPWDELGALGEALSSLPDPLPHATSLRFDPLSGYGPCVLPAAAWRRGLVEAYRSPRRALESAVDPTGACPNCAWQPRCAWRIPRDERAPEAMRALTEPEVLRVQSFVAERSASHVPGAAKKTDARAYGLPDLLCFAPFTSMSIHELRKRPVPCAQSWVDTTSTPEMEAEALGVPVAEVLEKNRVAQERWGTPWHDVMNEDWPLRDIWNAPLLVHMRRQMIRGGPSDRCRSSCRVVLGVEERGVAFLTRPDDELDPAVAANRRLLLNDMNERRAVLRALPLDLCVGVSAHCNISCGFCTGPMGRYGNLGDRRYDEVVSLLPTLLHLAAVGPGEPLMSPGFNRLLGHIVERGYPSLTVSVTTNGTLLRQAWVDRHRDVRWSMIRVSLNAGTASSYERMTGKPGYFEQVIAGIERLAALRASKRDAFELTLSCVLSTNVMGELGHFAALVHRYGATAVLEPMTGDLNGGSPYKTTDTIRLLGEECRAVASEYAVKNPPLARAFAAMGQFSDERSRKRLNVILPRR
jgi:MoaA/NifB/PqqE/SkfB family radical SAM enzyme